MSIGVGCTQSSWEPYILPSEEIGLTTYDIPYYTQYVQQRKADHAMNNCLPETFKNIEVGVKHSFLETWTEIGTLRGWHVRFRICEYISHVCVLSHSVQHVVMSESSGKRGDLK